MTEAASLFRDAIHGDLGFAPRSIIADGRVHRFSTKPSGKGDSGWYAFHDDDYPGGIYGCWSTGVQGKWFARSEDSLGPAEKQAHRERMKAMIAMREAEREKRQSLTAVHATKIWDDAEEAEVTHPYLNDKVVDAYGLHQIGDRLIVPVRVDGVLTSLQYIDAEGVKRFEPGGKVAGGHHLIGEPKDNTVVIAEGYATAASLHANTQHAVAVAFNARNLMPVALAMRHRMPGVRIVIAADDDLKTPGNPGVTAAREAAEAVGGLVATPPFDRDAGDEGTDWNDWVTSGVKSCAAVREAFERSCSAQRDHPQQIPTLGVHAPEAVEHQQAVHSPGEPVVPCEPYAQTSCGSHAYSGSPSPVSDEAPREAHGALAPGNAASPEADSRSASAAILLATDPEAHHPVPNGHLPPAQSDRATLLRASGIKSERIDWLWHGWLARGKLHLLVGAPSAGKSTLAIAMAGIVSSGGRFPAGSRAKQGSVMIWSSEDGVADTIRPRLEAAGADLDRVYFIDGVDTQNGPRPFDPSRDMQTIDQALHGIRDDMAMLILDPVVSAVEGDGHKANQVRRSLQPVLDLLERRNMAGLGITHFSKNTAGRDPTERVTGSVAFGAVARVVIVAAKEEVDEGQEPGACDRIMTRAKSNLGPDGDGFRYALRKVILPGDIETSRVVFGDTLTGSARALLHQAEDVDEESAGEALTEAVNFLLTELADGPVLSKDLFAIAKDGGISGRTLERAIKKVKVGKTKVGEAGGKGVWWRWLPQHGELDPTDPRWAPPPAVGKKAHKKHPDFNGSTAEPKTLSPPRPPTFERGDSSDENQPSGPSSPPNSPLSKNLAELAVLDRELNGNEQQEGTEEEQSSLSKPLNVLEEDDAPPDGSVVIDL
jgi:phage/plasmid primase-like uncharacterized protein/energy-coupling factor transporter ATP-binding protein EcfA2